MAKVSVLGAGSWGTALAVLLTQNGHETILWSHRQEQAEELANKREHEAKLPGVTLPEELEITADFERALTGRDVLVLAVPSVAVRSTARRMCPYIKQGQLIVNVAKGIEAHTLTTLTDMIEEEIPGAQACVLSGPSHAEEVSRGLPTTCVVGAKKWEIAEYLQNIFMNPIFRVYISPDILGIELGGALKNVIALAAGTADGLGYGDNTKAALITRGIAENFPSGNCHGSQSRYLLRAVRYRGFDCNLRQPPQPQSESRFSHGTGKDHGRSHGRSKHGGRRRLFCKGGAGTLPEVPGGNADYPSGKQSAV